LGYAKPAPIQKTRDVDGKTDDLGAILVKTDQTFATICGASRPGCSRL
jgi:hypothetical protein